MVSQRVRHELATEQQQQLYMCLMTLLWIILRAGSGIDAPSVGSQKT